MSVAYPFLRIPDELVVADPWTAVLDDEDPIEIDDGVPAWDYARRLTLSRDLEIDVSAASSAAGLDPAHTWLEVVVVLTSGPRGNQWRSVVARSGQLRLRRWSDHLVVYAPGLDLAHEVRLDTEIVLGEGVPKDGAIFAASHRGSVLWSDVVVVPLEGTSSRFPVELVDFRRAFPGRHDEALWYLDWDPTEPDAAFLGSVRLYLNSHRSAEVDRIKAGDPVLQALLEYDVVSQMLTVLLRSSEFTERADDFETGSVGQIAREWWLAAFGDVNGETARAQLRDRPGQVQARLLSVFGRPG